MAEHPTRSDPFRGRVWGRLAWCLLVAGSGWAAEWTAPGAVELVWQTGPGHRSRAVAVPAGGRPGFTLVDPARSGLQFTNLLSDRTVATNRIYENGSGVALGDVDGDGWCDIYLCGLEGANALFRNRGDWRFEDVTREAGVACPGQYSTGTAFADVDGDRDLDLLVNALGGGTRLFLNDGRGRFTELTSTRLVRRFGSTSMALADMDADGDLDLYVTNYRTDTYRDRPPGLKVEARMVGGRIVVTPEDRFLPVMPQGGAVEVVELGERDFLYVNDGAGRFAPVSWTAGSFLDPQGKALTAPPLDWGLSVLFRDLNHDRTPDLYICNDFFQSPDRVWINEGSRRFRAADSDMFRNMSMSSMAIDVADLNRDGEDDIVVVDMLSRRHRDRQRQRPEMMQGRIAMPVEDAEFRPETPRNTLYLNRGDGTYAEIAQLSGVAATEWSWSPVFLDVDLDGFEDLLIANGNHHDVQDADVIREIAQVRDRESPEARLSRFPRLHTPNLAFRNRGDLTFEECGKAWGFHWEGVSQGMALADLDGDGDLDVVLNNLNAGAHLYRNDSSAPRVAIRLQGLAPNTHGIGARIGVFGGAVPRQSQEITCGGRYASADDTVRMFAAGNRTNRLRIEVTWRNGRTSVLEGAEPDRLYEITEAGAGPTISTPAQGREPATEPWFEDVSDRLNHVHVDQPYDDLARQPLLAHRWSRLGPGVAWFAREAEGPDDLVIGGGAGGRLARYRPDGKGGFIRSEGEPVHRDQTGLAAWWTSTHARLLVATANYEDPDGGPSRVRSLEGPEARDAEAGPELPGSAGPLAVADVDGDGDLDLLVGGRIASGRYPEAASSRMYRNEGGRWILEPESTRALERIGLISGAVFADLDADGDPDLVLAGHWGPLRMLRNDAGQFRDITREVGLEHTRGWWNGVTTGDFDGDGRLDLVASNWGRNTPYHGMLDGKPGVSFGDFDGDGVIEVLETIRDPETGKVVPWQDYETVSRALPFLRALLPTYRAYAEADVSAVLGPVAGQASQLAVDTLDSHVFLNRSGTFVAVPLPVEAQFAPAFGISVADFNGDGREDLFLAQNFFGVLTEASRYDGGIGLCLEGDGRGGFRPMNSRQSGIRMSGEQRGCAVADFDGDGRPDLAVAQNHGATRLYRNREAQPGLRLRLQGGPDNPRGVGAVLQLEFGERRGPARAVHAGAGYWSQDSLTPVLATPEPATAVLVRWPGGAIHKTPVPPGSREIRISRPAPGELKH